jgi:ketosteroid isomerase-like protein
MSSTNVDISATAELARRLSESYDPQHPSPDVYADELVVWHNYDEREVRLDRDQLATGAEREHGALRRVLSDFGYTDRRLYAAADAVVMTHVMVGTLADGTPVRIPACHVYRLKDGRIARMDVYMDSGQTTALRAAFEAAGISLPTG